MLKYFVLLFNMIGLYFFQSLFLNDISATLSAPNKIKPGEEFTVNITVKKGTTSGFAQVKLDLPEGFVASASADETAGSEYKVTSQTIRFTWTSLPGDAELKLAFKVKADAGISGTKTIVGKFSYLNSGNKTAIETNKLEILVGDEKPVVTTNTTPPPPDNTPPPPPDNTNTSNNKSAPVEVTATRKVKRNAKPGEEFTVEITIFKGGLKGFSRFQDMVPDGLTATEGESNGGTFSFIDQKAKIVWDNVPSTEQFTISYKVKVANNAAGDLSFDGLFSYVENDEPKKIILSPSLITIEKSEENTTVVVNNNNTTSNNTNNNTTNNNITTDNTNTTTTTLNNKTENNDNNNTTTNNNTSNNKQENTVTNVTPPTTGVSYRVQICASHSEPVGNWYFSSMYGIQDNVKLETHEGWNKYTVGKYNQYKEARDYRETMRSKGINGAFVTAYNQGTRITVQEALMITSQQWYK